jgi:UDP-N-acetylmuramate dehydrogenase
VPAEASAAAREVAERLGSIAALDQPFGALTTYRVGGTAAVLATLGCPADVEATAAAVSATGIEVIVLGKGSNLVVADAGFPGLVIQLRDDYAAVTIVTDSGLAIAGGAVAYPVLARRTAAAGLTGLEWAVGVPGSVGGAVRMNAGGHGSDTAKVLVEATIVDLCAGAGAGAGAAAGAADAGSDAGAAGGSRSDQVDYRTVPASELALGYRKSAVTDTQVVLTAQFALSPAPAGQCEQAVSEVVAWRRAHQPGGQNAGSVFTNPEGDSAGRLVEQAGLKGHRLGSAQVSPKHANFIQADPGGSADDVIRLIAEVRNLVEQRTGVLLQPEVHLVGASL